MIIAGYEYRGMFPFKNVYFTGIVRDKLGRKMSKSLGNSPDPLMLIEKYGADGVRMGMMLSAPAGNDILFDETLCEQGRNFNNKIWNAFRLVKGWKVDANISQSEAAKVAVKWFEAVLNKTIVEIDDLFSKYRISEALMGVYKLFWDEFSAWYLEMVKPAFGTPIDEATYNATLSYFDALLRLLHPFMPFITEELWQNISERSEGESIVVARMPEATTFDAALIEQMESAKTLIAGVRTIRMQKNIANKDSVELQVKGARYDGLDAVVFKMANVSKLSNVEAFDATVVTFLVGTTEYGVPMGDRINVEEERKKIEADIKYYEGFLVSVQKKLSNEKFVNNAKPEVVENERNKQRDIESKLEALRLSLAQLSK